MKISMNLATRPWIDFAPALRRLKIAITAVSVLLVLTSAAAWRVHGMAVEERARIRAIDQQIARSDAERAKSLEQLRLPANLTAIRRTARFKAMLAAKSFSWTLIMQRLEALLPPQVRVTEIEPILSRDDAIHLRLHLSGRREAALSFVSNLESSTYFSDPRIVGESPDSNNGPAAASAPATGVDVVAGYRPSPPANSNSLVQVPAAAPLPSARPAQSLAEALPFHGGSK